MTPNANWGAAVRKRSLPEAIGSNQVSGHVRVAGVETMGTL
jgi:hypothetical protein